MEKPREEFYQKLNQKLQFLNNLIEIEDFKDRFNEKAVDILKIGSEIEATLHSKIETES